MLFRSKRVSDKEVMLYRKDAPMIKVNSVNKIGIMDKESYNEYESYFAFSNGIVVVRSNSIEVKRYEEVLDSSRVLMRDKIIGRDVSIVSKEEALSSDFADFCLR